MSTDSRLGDGLDVFEVEIGELDYGLEIGGILGMDFLCAAGAVVDETCHELEHVVVSCPDPSLLSVDTRRMLGELVASIRSCISRYEMRHRVKQWGHARTLEEIANRTLSCMRLTSRTWDALEAADLDDLTFVYTAICMDNHEWHLHHAIRAVIENPGMRRA
jgi:hypothetical protein